MQTLNLELGERSYPIHIGRDLFNNVELVIPHLIRKQIAVVTNTTVAPIYLEKFCEPLRQQGVAIISIVLPDGEKFKTMEILAKIYDSLLEHRCERNTTLVALGGGVIGDMAGYAAATFLRGIPFIQVPTTLLAQVDSSVGGKTGINHPLGKNMIGAFWQPKIVLADTQTLETLPDRELCAGVSEIIKYGLIRDKKFFIWLEKNMSRLLARDSQALAYAIQRSCENKAEVVAADERESGERALLNLGHTFGHAIEAGMGYGVWLHGEAVAAGTLLAADLSQRLGWLSETDVDRIKCIHQAAGLPIVAPKLGADTYLGLMSQDKKVSDGEIRLTLLQSIGKAVFTANYPAAQLRETLDAVHD